MPKVLIKSGPERFRRAGFEFTRAGVVVDTEDLSKEQIEAIADEPNLSARPYDEGAETKTPESSDGKAAKAELKKAAEGKKAKGK
jgi:hypothetical protein